MTKTRTIIVQGWTEYERGWGCRSDGYSVHLCEEDRKLYVKQYWDKQPKEVPDEYSKEDAHPYLLDVTPLAYEELEKLKSRGNLGMRIGRYDLDSLRPADVVAAEKAERERIKKKELAEYEAEDRRRIAAERVEREAVTAKREAILSKLTPEERKYLGL